MTIVEFLTARLDEDAYAAREAIDAPPAYGLAQGHDAYDESVNIASNEGGLVEAVNHMRRWNPERVLVDVDAKYGIVAMHREYERILRHEADTEATRMAARTAISALKIICQAFAQQYVDHPDFDPAWRVDA